MTSDDIDIPHMSCWLRGHRWIREVFTQTSTYGWFYQYRECKRCGKREAFN